VVARGRYPRRLVSARYTHALIVGALGLLLLLTVLTAWSRWEVGEPPGDFRCFDAAAERFLAGEPIYVHEHDHFDSPPFFIWLTLPAHALGGAMGHALAMFAGLGLSGLALWLVRRSVLPSPSRDATLAAGLYLPIWLSASIAQWGGAFFAAFAGTFFFASRKGREREAGLVLAVFLAKPTLALFVVPVVLLGLGRRALVGFAIGAAAWAVLSLPLGLEIWSAWIAQLRWASEAQAIVEHRWQHHTLLGTLRAALDPSVARVIWAVIAVPLGAVVLVIATRLLRRGDATRAFSLVALATVALNVYVRYYDSLIVLVPTLALVVRRDRARATGIVALTYLLLASADSAYFQSAVPVPLEGVLLTTWLVLELVEARGRASVSRSIPDLP
jgi:hypothetical protein